MEDLETIVQQIVLDIAQLANPAVDKIANADALTGELGLESLDLAQIVATLEAQTGLDPFAELVAVTSVRTVGDLVTAYRRARDGEKPTEDAAVTQSKSRAETRRARARQATRGRTRA